MRRRRVNRERRFKSDKVFDVANVIIMLVLLVIFAWPLWFVLIASISDPILVMSGKVLIIPKKLTLAGYEQMLEYKELWTGYANTIFITVVGTALNLIMSVCFAYPLADMHFKPRRILLLLFMFTMYFSGGLIPNYLIVKQLGILSNGIVVPCCMDCFGEIGLGDLRAQSLGEVLDSALYREIVAGFRQGVAYHPKCQRCDYARGLVRNV